MKRILPSKVQIHALGKKDEGVEEANHHLGILPTISRPYPSARHHSSRMIIRF